jgi:CO/xanthine dehydrogenase FAD-binding subunit
VPRILPLAGYRRADDLRSALLLLDDLGARARVLAGGTDLVVQLREGIHSDRVLVDVGRIAELRLIARQGDEIVIGALATSAEIASSPLITGPLGFLAEAARAVGGPQVRNRATVGGNIVNGSPAADLAPPLLALDADVVLESVAGKRRLPLEAFFTGYRTSVLAPNEILREVRFVAPRAARSAFAKIGQRNAAAISIVVFAGLAPAGPSSTPRLALGSVHPVPMRARRAESLVAGRALTPGTARLAAEAAAGECEPINDLRASAWYRREIVRNIVGEFLAGLA